MLLKHAPRRAAVMPVDELEEPWKYMNSTLPRRGQKLHDSHLRKLIERKHAHSEDGYSFVIRWHQLAGCLTPHGLKHKCQKAESAVLTRRFRENCIPNYLAPCSIQARTRPTSSLLNGAILALLSFGGM